MKQYSNINTNKKPEKKQRSYDISSELDVKETIKETKNSSIEYDLNNTKNESHSKIFVIPIVVAVSFTVLGLLIYAGYIPYVSHEDFYDTESIVTEETLSDNQIDEPTVRPYDDMFTFIDGSEILTLNVDDTLVFKSNPSNAGRGILIEFMVKDASTDEYYCDNTISDDGSFEWKPSDYIHDTDIEHTIGISQKAFSSDDLSTCIGSYYSTITIKLTD